MTSDEPCQPWRCAQKCQHEFYIPRRPARSHQVHVPRLVHRHNGIHKARRGLKAWANGNFDTCRSHMPRGHGRLCDISQSNRVSGNMSSYEVQVNWVGTHKEHFCLLQWELYHKSLSALINLNFCTCHGKRFMVERNRGVRAELLRNKFRAGTGTLSMSMATSLRLDLQKQM